MYKIAPIMTGKAMDIAAMLGSMMGGWGMGMAIHFINGSLVFPLAYVFLIYRLLPGPPVLKGTAWGVVLWLVVQLMLMPMMGAGVFSMNAGGMKSVVSSLIGHLVYGALLGVIAGAGVDAGAGQASVAAR